MLLLFCVTSCLLIVCFNLRSYCSRAPLVKKKKGYQTGVPVVSVQIVFVTLSEGFYSLSVNIFDSFRSLIELCPFVIMVY